MAGRTEDEKRAFLKREAAFAALHKNDTDDQLLRYVRDCGLLMGRVPKKDQVIGSSYLKSRLGPWPRILENAGLKQISKRRLARMTNNRVARAKGA